MSLNKVNTKSFFNFDETFITTGAGSQSKVGELNVARLGIFTATPSLDGFSVARDIVIKGSAKPSSGSGITIEDSSTAALAFYNSSTQTYSYIAASTANGSEFMELVGWRQLRFVSGRILFTGPIDQNIVSVPALDINCSSGNYFTKTISSDSTFTVSNVPTGRVYSFTLELTHTSGIVTWFANVQWPNNVPPSLTTGKTHLFMFVTDDGGSRWRGSYLINYTN